MTPLRQQAMAHPGRGLGGLVARAPFRSGQPDIAARALVRLLTWIDRSRQRKQLLELDEHRLRDIAVSRDDAILEGRKPFWQE